VSDAAPRIDPAAEAFGSAAADYERARPSYPPGAIDVLRRDIGVGPGVRVLDLAAGTGKLTRLLVGTGADVIAVEPVEGMRHQLSEVLPEIDVFDGTAETIPLDDASVDVVTVAQAFHWFQYDEALAEIKRVLKPGGWLVILFNRRDERVDWVRVWSDVIEWHGRRISEYDSIDWTALLNGAGYTDLGRAEVEWEQTINRDLLAARVRSVSYIAEKSPDEQQDYVDRVLALTDGFDDTFPLPYVTMLWFARSH
jgi:SAM-dependent methyltransferase